MLPMPLLARLQLDKVRKIGVMLMFALGLFVCITSIVRIHALQQSVKTDDPTWGSSDALLWSAIEADCGIICACLPYLKHPLKQLFPRIFSTLGSRAHRSRPTYKLSAFSSSRGYHRHSTATDDWKTLATPGRMGSQDPIAPNQIIMKTDISLKTERMDSADVGRAV
jgi:hypothetical protein